MSAGKGAWTNCGNKLSVCVVSETKMDVFDAQLASAGALAKGHQDRAWRSRIPARRVAIGIVSSDSMPSQR